MTGKQTADRLAKTRRRVVPIEPARRARIERELRLFIDGKEIGAFEPAPMDVTARERRVLCGEGAPEPPITLTLPCPHERVTVLPDPLRLRCKQCGGLLDATAWYSRREAQLDRFIKFDGTAIARAIGEALAPAVRYYAGVAKSVGALCADIQRRQYERRMGWVDEPLRWEGDDS